MSLQRKSIDDIPSVEGKRVLVRVDFNVPIKAGVIQNDLRVRTSLPSINKLISGGAKVILVSHLGRPAEKGYEEAFSLKPIAALLSELLGKPVAFAPDAMAADEEVAALNNGDVLLLENVRFYPFEGAKKAEDRAPMAEKLASYAEIYVSDAFGTAHRDSASMTGVPKILGGGYAGYLMQKEIDSFHAALEAPKRPLVAISGGSKVSDKILLLENLILTVKCDAILIGGAMAYTFIAARGGKVGKSLCERVAQTSKGEVDILETARKILKTADTAGVKVILPVDHAVAAEFGPSDLPEIVDEIPDDKMALDIGPKTLALFKDIISTSGTVIWNGPVGAFEVRGFERGTFGVVDALAAATDAVTIVGGGDSAAAAQKSGLGDKLTHISTGGGAALELMEGKVLPGIAALSPKE